MVIYYPEKLVLGQDTGISMYCQLNAAGGIEIGDSVLIGPGAMIWSQNHRFEDVRVPIQKQGYLPGRVVIENDVWIGAGAIVLAGTQLARGTVVAAGAVVTRSTEPYTIVAGIPARKIGCRGRSGSEDATQPLSIRFPDRG